MAEESNTVAKDYSFALLSLHEEYTAKGPYIEKKVFHRTPCFAQAFRYATGKVDYSIRIYKGGEVMSRRKANNSCFAGLNDIKKHMARLKKFVPGIKYKIVEEKGRALNSDGGYLSSSDFDRYVLHLTIDAGNIYHRYALSWIRYLYEFPANMILNDAYRLKKEKGFGNLSIESLFILVSSCVPTALNCDMRESQSISVYGPLYTANVIKHRLKRADEATRPISHYDSSDARLYDVFSNRKPLASISRPIINRYDQQQRDEVHTLSYWTSEDRFKERVEKYRETLKRYREGEKDRK